MKTLLQAQKALAAAEKVLARQKASGDARAASAAAKLVTAAHNDVVAALEGVPALKAQLTSAIEARVVHKMKHEETTVEKSSKASVPASSAESSATSGEGAATPPGGPATQDSAASSPPASKAKTKGKKAAVPAKKAESEEEREEKALLGGFEASLSGYKKHVRGAGFDAYALKGPLALLKACQKALGTTGVEDTFGALAALPTADAANAGLVAKVEKLEANDRAGRVNAIVVQLKAEGRAPTKELRAELRALGMEKGTRWLKGYGAKLPKAMRTLGDGALMPASEGEHVPAGASGVQVNDKVRAQIEREAMAGMSPEEQAEFKAALDGKLKKTRTRAAVV